MVRKNTVGCGTTTDLLLWPVDHDQRDLGGGKADTFDGTSGKGGGLDSQGFSGSGHGDQRVPVIDHTGIGFRQDLRRGKALSALPGIGNAADGLLELAVGSAVVIRNSIGVLLLLLLLAVCAAPLLEILFTAFLIKCAAAFMGIVSDKRVTNCTDHMGNAGMLLFRTAGTAMLLFLITLALLAIGSRGR